MNLGGRRDRTGVNRETLQEVRDVVAVRTTNLRPGGLRCDFDRLDADAQRRVVELVNTAGQGRSWSWSRLGDKDRRELERLIEQASREPGIFENARQMEEVAELAASAHRAKVRRPLRNREEAGIFTEIAAGIEGGSLGAADVAMIAVISTAFVSGKPLGPRTRIDLVGDTPVLVVEDAASLGLYGGKFDEEQQLAPRWKATIQWLEEIGWFEVEKRGKEWSISAGPRMKLALAGLRKAA
jgi:hypothetical protein